MIVLVVFAFAASMLALSSCAKKQVATDRPRAAPAAMTAPSRRTALRLQRPAAAKADPLAAEIKAFESEAHLL